MELYCPEFKDSSFFFSEMPRVPESAQVRGVSALKPEAHLSPGPVTRLPPGWPRGWGAQSVG